MELIIDIDEITYSDIKRFSEIHDGQIHILKKSILNGKPLQAEIEKIKTDIDEIAKREMKEDMNWSLGLRYSKKIIDKRIAELKGENNAE